jgi:acyl carrier protein
LSPRVFDNAGVVFKDEPTMSMSRDQVLAEVLELLNSVVGDWEFEGSVGANTRLFADLALESLDLVILGAKVQEHFGRTLPFTQLFAEIGQRDIRDVTIGEWADFVAAHLAQPPAAAAVASAEAV